MNWYIIPIFPSWLCRYDHSNLVINKSLNFIILLILGRVSYFFFCRLNIYSLLARFFDYNLGQID